MDRFIGYGERWSPNGYCGGALGLTPDQLGLDRWRELDESSGVKGGAVGFCAAHRPTPKRSDCDSLSMGLTLRCTLSDVRFGRLEDTIWSGPQKEALCNRLLESAGFGGRLRVAGLDPEPERWGFRFEILDPAVPFVGQWGKPPDGLPSGVPCISGTHLICDKDSPHADAFQSFGLTNLTACRAIDIFREWQAILYPTPPVVCGMEFWASEPEWAAARRWLSDRLPGPWVLWLIATRCMADDLEGAVSAGLPKDAWLPLCYWKASAGPKRLFVDAVSNGDGRWELWVAGTKSISPRAAATVRADLVALTGIEDLFSISQNFPCGGDCDYIMGY
jgi:hypothetical protein